MIPNRHHRAQGLIQSTENLQPRNEGMGVLAFIIFALMLIGAAIIGGLFALMF